MSPFPGDDTLRSDGQKSDEAWSRAEQQYDAGRDLSPFPTGDTNMNAELYTEAEAAEVDADLPLFVDSAWRDDAEPESQFPLFVRNGVWDGADAGVQHWGATSSGPQQPKQRAYARCICT